MGSNYSLTNDLIYNLRGVNNLVKKSKIRIERISQQIEKSVDKKIGFSYDSCRPK